MPGATNKCATMMRLPVNRSRQQRLSHQQCYCRLRAFCNRPFRSALNADGVPGAHVGAAVRCSCCRGQKKVYVPKIGLPFWAPVANFNFFLRTSFLMWVGCGLSGPSKSPPDPPAGSFGNGLFTTPAFDLHRPLESRRPDSRAEAKSTPAHVPELWFGAATQRMMLKGKHGVARPVDREWYMRNCGPRINPAAAQGIDAIALQRWVRSANNVRAREMESRVSSCAGPVPGVGVHTCACPMCGCELWLSIERINLLIHCALRAQL